jgi:hypothetical protein
MHLGNCQGEETKKSIREPDGTQYLSLRPSHLGKLMDSIHAAEGAKDEAARERRQSDDRESGDEVVEQLRT